MKDKPTVRYKAPTEKHAREVGERLAELLGQVGGYDCAEWDTPAIMVTLRVHERRMRPSVGVHSKSDRTYKTTKSLPKFWRWVYRWYGVDIVEAMKAKVAEDLFKPSAGDLLALLVKAAEDLPNDSQLTHAPAIVAAQLWLQKESAKPEAKPDDSAERAKNWGGLMKGDRVDDPLIADASVLQKVPSSNVRDQRNISVEWMAIWEQMEAWSGDHTKKETGQQLLERLQKDYQLTKTNAKPDGSAKRAKNWGGLMPGDRVDVTAKSGLIVRTVIRTVGVKSSDHLPVFVTNEDGEGHDWLDTRLFTITRVEEQKELTKA